MSEVKIMYRGEHVATWTIKTSCAGLLWSDTEFDDTDVSFIMA